MIPITDPGSRDKETLDMKRFNDCMFSSRDFFTTIVPLKDGIMIAYGVR